jgi:hypothetical protein
MGTAGTDDVVLINANDGIEYRNIFLAMVAKQGDTANGHFRLSAHHLHNLRGFVSGGLHSSTGVELGEVALTEMTPEDQKGALEFWIETASKELLSAGPWFPCSQFGCCKVQGS